MGKVQDQAALDAYRYVLLNLGHVTGYIQWQRLPRDWLDRELAGYTQKMINELMATHAKTGGTIHQVVETRPEYIRWRFHYDLRLPISGRRIYIETVFRHERDLEDCEIIVVNMHDA
ncbi:MAG: hypothetical protein ABR964_15920 [Tepidisphaeraceae bacterium]|jgi:hypothetical protein